MLTNSVSRQDCKGATINYDKLYVCMYVCMYVRPVDTEVRFCYRTGWRHGGVHRSGGGQVLRTRAPYSQERINGCMYVCIYVCMVRCLIVC